MSEEFFMILSKGKSAVFPKMMYMYIHVLQVTCDHTG